MFASVVVLVVLFPSPFSLAPTVVLRLRLGGCIWPTRHWWQRESTAAGHSKDTQRATLIPFVGGFKAGSGR
jgi:hypothetical protein